MISTIPWAAREDDWPSDLRESTVFRTLPPVGQGSISVRHHITRDTIRKKVLSRRRRIPEAGAVAEGKDAVIGFWGVEDDSEGRKLRNPDLAVDPVPLEDYVVPEQDGLGIPSGC